MSGCRASFRWQGRVQQRPSRADTPDRRPDRIRHVYDGVLYEACPMLIRRVERSRFSLRIGQSQSVDGPGGLIVVEHGPRRRRWQRQPTKGTTSITDRQPSSRLWAKTSAKLKRRRHHHDPVCQPKKYAHGGTSRERGAVSARRWCDRAWTWLCGPPPSDSSILTDMGPLNGRPFDFATHGNGSPNIVNVVTRVAALI